jgi:ubiquitin C-terminal hydrolase
MKGFINLGNTCYLNAGLQMIIQNKDLCNLILQYSKYSEILKKIELFILNYYNSNNNSPISPQIIKEIVENKQEIFIGYSQQDSTEFIIYFLNIIDDELLKIKNENKLTINLIYGIQFNVRIKCKLLTCLTIYNNKESNNFLIFNIDNNDKTLDDIYIKFKSSDKLDDDNKFYCEKCKDKRIASKRVNIESFSNHLIIWIKRFNVDNNFISKNCQHIEFPLIWKNKMLKGFIIHYGNIHGGHYIYISNINNNWYIFDDSNISLINDEQLKQLLPNAYVLYYSN